MRGGRAGEADADPDERVAERDLPVRDALLPEQQHRQEAEQDEDVAEEQREAGAAHLDQLGRPRRDHDHERGRRQDRQPRVDGRVAEHVLQELLADEHRAHQRAEDDDPGAGRHPEGRPRGRVQVVERVRRPALPDHERDQREQRRRRTGRGSSPVSFGTAAKLIAEDQRADEHDREHAAEVVDRLGRLVHVARHEHERHHERDHRQRHGEQEHRSPPEVLEQDPGAERAERGDRAAGGRPERDRPRPRRPRPERRDQRERRRVGHAGRQPAEHPRAEQHVDRSAPRRRGSPPGIVSTMPRTRSSLRP